MKNLILIVLFTAFLFAACDKTEDPESFNFGSESKFKHGNINKSGDNSLKFSIIEINDSRCPSDVVCVWQGMADVKVEIESPQKGTLSLNTYDNLIDTFGIYSFELIEVTPHPISTKNIELKNYLVTLNIQQIK